MVRKRPHSAHTVLSTFVCVFVVVVIFTRGIVTKLLLYKRKLIGSIHYCVCMFYLSQQQHNDINYFSVIWLAQSQKSQRHQMSVQYVLYFKRGGTIIQTEPMQGGG